jgi:L-seryl-tRNA(Ser) seleniumtransferase
LNEPSIEQWFGVLSRPLVTRLASAELEGLRRRLRAGEPFPGFDAVTAAVAAACRAAQSRRVTPVVNATGVALHTNMGRAPLPSSVWDAVREVNTGYSNLELDLDSGKRGRRNGILPELLSLLVGAESCLVVNNNAAAVFLVLTALARGREVIVSRGEQVQIGGGFRIPEILALSGARLVEVGTTNITRLADYTAAIGPDTSMVLVVHNSNFRIRGFTDRPSVSELAGALPPEVVLAVDQGSGATTEELPGERSVAHYLRSGAGLVCFSGDKVLAGPQAGIIVGRRDLVEILYRHPLNRTFRPGKTVYSLLEELLVQRLNGAASGPAEALLTVKPETLRRRGRRLAGSLRSPRLRLVPAPATSGGGSSPDESFPSWALEVEPPDRPEELLAALREQDPPIIGTVSRGRVLLNLATVRTRELAHVRDALRRLLEPSSAAEAGPAGARTGTEGAVAHGGDSEPAGTRSTPTESPGRVR